jgi:hypothetical protein
MTGIMKRVSPTAVFLIAIIIVMAVFFVTSMGYAELKVKLMPSLMSGAAIVLALIALINDLRSGSKGSAPTDEDGDVIEDEQLLKTPLIAYFQAFGWFVALIVVVYCLGFLIAIPLWLLVYLWKQGYKWWTALATGVILSVICYVVFTVLLQIELYQGLITKLVLDLF